MTSFDQETARKILTQVEFYFSDSNLPRDKFLYRTVNRSKDGMVSLALLCSFSRMRNHLGVGPLKPDDIPEKILEAVAEILRKSNFLKVSDDGKRVGRIIELSKPEETLKEVDKRTIAVSPFEYNVKIDDLESFFQQYGKVRSVRLSPHVGDKRHFSGTALIEFSTEDETDKILKENLNYAGARLILATKKNFDLEREKMIKEFQKSRSLAVSIHNDGSSRIRGSYRKGLLVAFSLKMIDNGENNKKKKKRKQRSRSKTFTETSEETVPKEKEGNNSEDASLKTLEGEEKWKDAQESTITAEVHYDVSCDELKAVFERFGPVQHVDYTPGSDSGYICFQEAETAVKAFTAMEYVETNCLAVNKIFSAFLVPVTGQAEREFWKRFTGDQLESQTSGDSREWKKKTCKDKKRYEGRYPESRRD